MKKNKVALIVEDEHEICLLIETILSLKNIPCRFAHTLEMARKVLQEYQPGVIFLDQNLPDGLGLEYIQEFRSSQNNGMKIIVMTAQGELTTESVLKKGADAFLKKPFTIREINTILETFL